MKRVHWNQTSNKYISAGALSIAGCFLMVAFPQMALNGCRSGLDLFMTTVLPTLFPFFVAVNFMAGLGLPERMGRLFEGSFRRIYGCSGEGAFICICSLFSGYPMAAKLVGDGVRSGRFSPAEGKRILSFSCVGGPLFMVGTVGTAMLGNALYGYVIALAHYLAAMINGLLFCRVILPAECGRAVGSDRACTAVRRDSLAELLSSAIFSAFRTLAQICGFILLFSMASSFLDGSGILKSDGLSEAPWPGALVKGLLEMTTGCAAVSELTGVTLTFQLALCGGLLAFGGLSIAGQSLSMLAGSEIESGYYFMLKLCHGCLAALLTAGLAVAAQKTGLMAVEAGVIYGSQNPTVQTLGGLHTLIFSAKSIAVICGLMVLIMAVDRAAVHLKRRKTVQKHHIN